MLLTSLAETLKKLIQINFKNKIIKFKQVYKIWHIDLIILIFIFSFLYVSVLSVYINFPISAEQYAWYKIHLFIFTVAVICVCPI